MDPVDRDWRLNERHYGALQGLNKAETAAQARRGADQDLAPELRHPAAGARRSTTRGIRRTTRATRHCAPAELPATESLKDTVARFLPYWHDTIAPAIAAGRRVLITAHGNSLRALVKYLDGISDEDIVELNIPTGIPLVYELDDELSRSGTTTWAIRRPRSARPKPWRRQTTQQKLERRRQTCGLRLTRLLFRSARRRRSAAT